MKRVAIAILAALTFSSCGKIWDFANPDVFIFVRNSDGQNLLDPNVENNILNSDITVEYEGAIHSIAPRTRDSGPAVWGGLRIAPVSEFDNSPVLKFGEFKTSSGSDGYHGETFTINWGDGTSDEVKFDLFVRGSHKVVKKIWLNGELRSDGSLNVSIVK